MAGLLSLNLPRPPEQPRTEKRSLLDWSEGFGALSLGPTASGENISELRAMQIATVYSCVTIIAKAVGTLPVILYRHTAKGKVPATDHPLQFMLGTQPNDETPSAASFWEAFTGHLVLSGNGYAEIARNRAGDAVALYILDPRWTSPYRDPQTGAITYRTSDAESRPGTYRVLAPENVLHVPLYSRDGIHGLSPIQQCREMLGTTLALDKFGARFFKSFATPQLVLTVDEVVTPEDKARIRADWEKLHCGQNTHRVAVLDQGMDLKPLSISPEEAQFLDSQRFNRSQISAMFGGVPLHLLGDDSKISRANTEELNRQFYTDCLQPIISRIVAAIAVKVLPRVPGEASDYSVEFSATERLKGDEAAQMNRIKTLAYVGAMTCNEAREAANLPNLGPAGDVLLTPANMLMRKTDGQFIDTPAVQSMPGKEQELGTDSD